MLSATGRRTCMLLRYSAMAFLSSQAMPCRADDWPMRSHDARNTAATEETVKPPLRLLWHVKTIPAASVVLSSGGAVCAASSPGSITDTAKTFLFNAAGRRLWTLQDALPLYLQESGLIVLSGATRRSAGGGRLQSYDWHTQTAQWSQPLGGTLKSWDALYGAIVSGERLYLSFVYTPLLPRTGEAGMAVGALKAWNARNGKPLAQAISGVEEWGVGPPACDGKMVYQGLSHHLDARDADTLVAHTSWSDGGNAYPIITGRQLIIKGWMVPCSPGTWTRASRIGYQAGHAKCGIALCGTVRGANG